MKQVTIAGRVGKDAEVKDTKAGPVCKFSVAVSARKKDDPATWFSVSLFGKRGEGLAQYIRKGDAIAVAGDLEVRTYEKDGQTRIDLGVVASEVTLQGGKRDASESQSRGSRGTSSSSSDDFGGYGGDDPDIPF